MSVIVRGAKNAFRSGVRTTAIVLILAISMGLGLSLLLANQAVNDRLRQVKQQIGTAITVNPAGMAFFQGGGEPLKQENADTIKTLAHVAEVSTALSLAVTTKSDDPAPAGPMGGVTIASPGGFKMGETNLEASVDPGTIGKRIRGGGDVAMAPADIKLPIRFVGISGQRDEQGQMLNVTSGRNLQAGDTNQVVIGKGLATKNNMTVGSTFTAYDETFTVVGLFDSDTEFGNDAIYAPLATAQRVAEAGTEVMNVTVLADSVDNVEAVVASIQQTLGKDKVDVTSGEENAQIAVDGLKSVERVSMLGFIAAVGAASIIILLSMVMVVRERRREIAVYKAIGASNRTIAMQFMVEAVVLVMMGSVVGLGVAVASGNGIASALVESNTTQAQAPEGMGSSSGGGFKAVRIEGGGKPSFETAKDVIGNVTTNVSAATLGYGLLAAIIIAVLGSAFPAWLTAKVRPAEVLRGE